MSYRQRTVFVGKCETEETARLAAAEIPEHILRVDESTSFESLRIRVKQWKIDSGRFTNLLTQNCVINGFRICRTTGTVLVRSPHNVSYVSKSKKIWEEAHGPIPKGSIVGFKDGNRLDCRLENLQLFEFWEYVYRKQFNDYPAELKSTIDALVELKRTIKNKSNQKPSHSGGGGRNRFWSDGEKRFLKENFLAADCKTIAGQLNRTPHSVLRAVRRFGLKNVKRGEINAEK